MNVFLSFVKKESLHILRDKRTMLIVLLIPVILMVLFGFAISTELNSVDVAVVSNHRTGAVCQTVDKLQNNPYFNFYGYISPKEIDKLLRSGKVQAVICFADDYDAKMLLRSDGIKTSAPIQIEIDAAESNMAQSISAYLQNLLSNNSANNQLFRTQMRHNPQMKSAYNFVPGIMGLIFILICAMMTSVSIVREKESGTMEVLLVSPIRPMIIVISKMVPYLILSLINFATILLLSHYLLDVPLSGSIATLIGISVLYIILSLSLGLFVSTMADTQLVALLISAVVMMIPVMMLSGMLFPIENLPHVLRELTAIVPARWYIDAIRKLMIEGLSFKDVWQDTLILLIMTILLITASLVKFNEKLD